MGDETLEGWEAVLRTNLTGAFLVARAALPSLVERGGALVAVASVNAWRAGPGWASYCTSKAGLVMLVQSIARDYGPKGVRANAVLPGWVRTPMGDEDMDALACPARARSRRGVRPDARARPCPTAGGARRDRRRRGVPRLGRRRLRQRSRDPRRRRRIGRRRLLHRLGRTVNAHERLPALMRREEERFVASHPRSGELAARAHEHLLAGVPMHWMRKWAGGFPLFVAEATGSRFVDVDGHEYVDLCLGDTGAMSGHAPAPTLRAIEAQAARGITTMLPTEDALWVGAELARRFGLPRWQFALTATDANRFVIRLARHVTGRPKVLVFNWCYHGTVDETFATLADGVVGPRRGNLGPPVDPALTTRVVEFNDVQALEAALAPRDVAVVLAEPALTNIGIVHADPGFHDALRALTRETGTLLAIDETHTICCGPGGYTAVHGLSPDILTIGKPIAGGVPASAYGFSAELADRVAASIELEDVDVGGVGGTLAANALSLAAMRATLGEVLTDEAFVRMEAPRGALDGGGRGGDRRERPPVARHAPRLSCGVPLRPGSAPQRHGGARRGRLRARALHAPARAEPGDPADPVPQHGADVPGDDRTTTSTCTRGSFARPCSSSRERTPERPPGRRLLREGPRRGRGLLRGTLPLAGPAPAG